MSCAPDPIRTHRARSATRSRVAAISSLAAITIALATSSDAQAADPPKLGDGQHFVVDPVYDGVVTGAGAVFSVVLGFVISTGELRPNTPGDATHLLGIDRGAVTQRIDPNAALYSDIALATGVSYAVLDSVLSGVRDGWDALLVDGVIYAETASISVALNNATKVAVRRPRPRDYINCGAPSATLSSGCASTDIQLSFYSGHASGVAAVTGSATYLAFTRSGVNSWRPWLTLAGGTALTTFVSYERVRAGAHFPTDVIVGAVAGASVGVLIPHLHRHKSEAPNVWVGVNGTGLSLEGRF